MAWQRAEQKVKNFLKYRGIESDSTPHKTHYDLLTENGLRVEVKYATFRNLGSQWGWKITFHRHNVLDEREVDFYCIVLQNPEVFGRYVLNLVIPAPIKKTTVQISPRSLVSRWAGFVNNWRALVAAEQAAA
jgi:hypothetical protein